MMTGVNIQYVNKDRNIVTVPLDRPQLCLLRDGLKEVNLLAGEKDICDKTHKLFTAILDETAR